MTTDSNQFKNINEYISSKPKDIQTILDEICNTIKKAIPRAEETFSYGMPAYKVDNKIIIYFAAWKNHIDLYPYPRAIEAFKKELSEYKQSKGAIQLPLDKPIPYHLIKRIVLFNTKL